MRQARQEDRAASSWFERVFAEHYELVARYALRRTGGWEDAADVAAETLLIAWRRREQAPEGDAVRLWLYGIARRVVANHVRGGRRQEYLIARLRSEPAPAAAADSGVNGTSDVLNRMKPGDREILILIAVEGLSPAEAAVVLGCSAVSVRVRLHRARARFAQMLSATDRT
ncbi:RNA polymerase sigma factor [Actinoplanes solisilvae]|uniref:RNA polymerase sigma factor n=1 Tax=Actinoplanes solisilvae TaxID=2486853 RepID=UPI000FD83B48|nr:RNA polymerase sigma factor [Actinoplanes solisilvae]